jgi:hypothetical protein
MFQLSRGPDNLPLSAVVLVGFERGTGQVCGTCVHGFHGATDEAGIARSRERLLQDLGTRIGKAAELVIQLPLADVAEGWIERVDPVTRKAVIAKSRTAITHP